MKQKRLNPQRYISDRKMVPSWICVTLGMLIFSGIVMGIIFVTGTITFLTNKDPVIILGDFESQDRSYQIKLPKGWFPYESQEGIHGDAFLIVQSIEGSRIQPSFDIARVNMPDADLDQIVAWEESRIHKFPNTTMLSMDQYNTVLYEGKFIIYGIDESGYMNRYVECRDWVIYQKPTGYVIRMCTTPTDWSRMNDPFREMIESFKIKN